MANARIVNTPSQAVPQNGVSHLQVTISGTATAICSSLNADTTHVFVQFNGGNVRVTLDGTTNPTTSLGFVYSDGSTAYWTRTMALKAKAIIDDGATVIAEVQELNYL